MKPHKHIIHIVQNQNLCFLCAYVVKNKMRLPWVRVMLRVELILFKLFIFIRQICTDHQVSIIQLKIYCIIPVKSSLHYHFLMHGYLSWQDYPCIAHFHLRQYLHPAHPSRLFQHRQSRQF